MASGLLGQFILKVNAAVAKREACQLRKMVPVILRQSCEDAKIGVRFDPIGKRRETMTTALLSFVICSPNAAASYAHTKPGSRERRRLPCRVFASALIRFDTHTGETFAPILTACDITDFEPSEGSGVEILNQRTRATRLIPAHPQFLW